jgi:chromate transporter
MLAGLKPAVVALIFFSAWSVATIAIETWLAAMIALVAFGVVMSRRVHPIAVIAAGALVGVLFM